LKEGIEEEEEEEEESLFVFENNIHLIDYN